MTQKEETLRWLDEQGIPYRLIEHPAVYTMEELTALELEGSSYIVKNLFLRNSSGKFHYLLLVNGDKRVDLKSISEQIGTRLSFASEERLQKHLNLTKGAVTPLGILYDESHSVKVLIDNSLQNAPQIGCHPCDNTATVFLSMQNLYTAIQHQGNSVSWIEIE